MFNILDLDTEEYVVNEETGNALMFLTGGVASDYCKKNSDKRLQPRKFVDNPNWQRREEDRLGSGEYKPIPAWMLGYQYHDWHFLHMSKEKPPLLSYTKSKENGRADVQNRISWENYLKKYHPTQSARDLKSLLDKFEIECKPPSELKFATTGDEISKVYTDYHHLATQVAGSCMRHSYKKTHPHHPTYIYGAGDLAVAYLTDKEGKTVARALVWPEKKLYSRVYADNDHLHALLKKEGYTKSAYHQGTGGPAMVGAKLLKIEMPKAGKGVYLMPFIDEPVVVQKSPDKKHFVTALQSGCASDAFSPRYQTGTSTGYQMGEDQSVECACCDTELDRRHARRVYTNRNDSSYYCEECCDETLAAGNFFFCAGDQRYYDAEDVGKVTNAAGETWSSFFYDNHGFTCQKLNTIHHVREVQDCWVNKKTFELWGPKAKAEHAWKCDRMNRFLSNDIPPVKVNYQGRMQNWNPFSVAVWEKDGKMVKQADGSYLAK